jgi:hypothetical protein
MSERDVPKTGEDLQDAQDPDASETRHDEEEGPSTTPLSQTDHEQDDEDGDTSAGG